MTGTLTYAAASERQAEERVAAARSRRVPGKPRRERGLPLLSRRRRRRAYA
jgi:hypothetical protein